MSDLENTVNADPRAQAAPQEKKPQGIFSYLGNYVKDSVYLAIGSVYDITKKTYKVLTFPIRNAFKTGWQLLKNPFVLMGAYFGSQLGGSYGPKNGATEPSLEPST